MTVQACLQPTDIGPDASLATGEIPARFAKNHFVSLDWWRFAWVSLPEISQNSRRFQCDSSLRSGGARLNSELGNGRSRERRTAHRLSLINLLIPSQPLHLPPTSPSIFVYSRRQFLASFSFSSSGEEGLVFKGLNLGKFN